MTRISIILNDGRYINTAADRMEIHDNLLFAWSRDNLTAVVEMTAIVSAHLSGSQSEKV